MAATQDLMVDISIGELLAAKAAEPLLAMSLRRPATFLQSARSLVRRGTTELVLLAGFDELLERAGAAHGEVAKIDIAIGIEAVKEFANTVGTPVVHIGSPDFRKLLSECPRFCQTWRWEIDMFSIDQDHETDVAYFLERCSLLGLTDIGPGAYPAKLVLQL